MEKRKEKKTVLIRSKREFNGNLRGKLKSAFNLITHFFALNERNASWTTRWGIVKRVL